MRNIGSVHSKRATHEATPVFTAVVIVLLCLALTVQGCFDPVYPQLDREERVMEALAARDAKTMPSSPLSPADAVIYALANNLDAKVAEIETAYYNESAVAARRRLLPSLNLRYSMDHSNHPSARWSESTSSGNQSLESSYSSDPNSRQGEVGVMWNVIDFGVGYLRSRQQGERIRHSAEQQRRVRQQVVLEVLTHYWRTAAAETIAREAEQLRKELDEQATAIRDSVEMRILSGAEGARRELAVHGGIAELEQWRRSATQARLELARVMGCGNAKDFTLADFPSEPPALPPMPGGDPSSLQTAALQRRPELFQQDVQERIAVDEARIALLQMAPTANLSLSAYDDPDKFLEWGNWMTVGARVSWNLFNIPARLAERRMAKTQGDTAKQKGLALAAAIMAQVGIAYSEWRLSHEYASILSLRSGARQRLVDALAAGEKDGQTRPGEVLQERVRLLSERAASLRANAEARVAGARLANAIGLDVDASGRLLWKLGSDEDGVDLLYTPNAGAAKSKLKRSDAEAVAMLPENVSGLKVVKAEDFLTPDTYFIRPGEAKDDSGTAQMAVADDTRPEIAPPGPESFAVEPESDSQYAEIPETGTDWNAATAYAPPWEDNGEDEYVLSENAFAEDAGLESGYGAMSIPKTEPPVREAVMVPPPSVQQPEPEYKSPPATFEEHMDRQYPAELALRPPAPAAAAVPEAVAAAPVASRQEERPWEYYDESALLDLAKTAYNEDVGVTRISESMPALMEQAEAPLIMMPEEIQAQVSPELEGFSSIRKLPLTSFIGPEEMGRKKQPARTGRGTAAMMPPPSAPPPQAREIQPLTISSAQSAMVPVESLRPPDPREMERLQALSPLASVESVGKVGFEADAADEWNPLRPPKQGATIDLTPPVGRPSPSDFGF